MGHHIRTVENAERVAKLESCSFNLVDEAVCHAARYAPVEVSSPGAW
jgi:hypothetical protein